MTIPEEILKAVYYLIKKRGKKKFRREDVRKQVGVDRDRWDNSYSPTFQGMRIDHPGGAPDIGKKYKGVFQRVSYGVHTLTEYGKELIEKISI